MRRSCADGKQRAWLFGERVVQNETLRDDCLELKVCWSDAQAVRFRNRFGCDPGAALSRANELSPAFAARRRLSRHDSRSGLSCSVTAEAQRFSLIRKPSDLPACFNPRANWRGLWRLSVPVQVPRCPTLWFTCVRPDSMRACAWSTTSPDSSISPDSACGS